MKLSNHSMNTVEQVKYVVGVARTQSEQQYIDIDYVNSIENWQESFIM